VKQLADLLEKFEGPLTADFQRHYTLRLESAVVERSEVEVLDLIYWLPQASAFAAVIAANGDRKKARGLIDWDIQSDLMLNLLNTVRHQSYVIAQSSSPKKVAVPKSIPNPRSGSAKPGGRQDANSMAKVLLQSQKG
jgi:hypothetical protein